MASVDLDLQPPVDRSAVPPLTEQTRLEAREIIARYPKSRSALLPMLHLDGMSETLPAPGTPVTAGTREVGRLGTAVRHHEQGVIALALVKQSLLSNPGKAHAELRVGETVAVVDPDDAVAEVDDTRAAARDRIRAVRSATMPRA